MAHRLHGERAPLTVGDLVIEVQPIVSDTAYRTTVGLGSAYFAAPDPAAVQAALSALASWFCIEAQPTWSIVDHRGVVAATPAGMLRLPDELVLEMASEWAAAFVAEPPETAVDKLIPPGEMRDELNRRLRAAA